MAGRDAAGAAGTFTIGAGRTVNRMGFGAMRITGRGIWGPPADADECRAVLRRALDLGVNLIDTADSYGPHVSEELIAEALHPYPEDLLIATKGGLTRTGPNQWPRDGSPEHLREPCGPFDHITSAHDATAGQVALAWLLARSAVMVPIPGTSSVEHLEKNLAAAEVELSADELAELEALAG